MKKGEVHTFSVDDYAFEGKGIARIDGGDESGKKFVVFIHGAYPGDVVEAQIRRKKRSYAEAKVTRVITPSSERTEARCSFFGTCGGCKQQDLDYEKQLFYKQEQVKDVFERIGGFDNPVIESIVASDPIYFYRNKLEYSFADRRWLTKEEISSDDAMIDRNFALGFHIPRVFDKVLDINECFLQSEVSNSILNFTRDFFKSRDISIYSTKTHEGFLRNLVIKESHHTHDLMVNIVTSAEDDNLIGEYSEGLKELVPAVTTIINNINLKKSQVAIGDYEKVFFGSGIIHDEIGKYKFRISANSFFQTNTLQAVNLYNTALEFAELTGNEIVYDLYSGAGTISIYMSESAKKVYAFESVEAAVKDAAVNNGLNNIENVEYFMADLNKSLLPLLQEKGIPSPDMIMLDPPRSGMNPKTVNDVIKLAPAKIVYVSCNPASQARDVKLLCDNGYKLVKLRPVDMFPHTYHIENVSLLIRH